MITSSQHRFINSILPQLLEYKHAGYNVEINGKLHDWYDINSRGDVGGILPYLEKMSNNIDIQYGIVTANLLNNILKTKFLILVIKKRSVLSLMNVRHVIEIKHNFHAT